MAREHHYAAHVVWAGGSTAEAGYDRTFRVEIEGKPVFEGSADPNFRGDPGKHNPEDLLLASLAACHLLSYLALCQRAGIEVVRYEDQASGLMAIKDGKMRFTEVTLAPRVTIATGDVDKATELHEAAHDLCFIANSVNFPVLTMPTVTRA